MVLTLPFVLVFVFVSMLPFDAYKNDSLRELGRLCKLKVWLFARLAPWVVQELIVKNEVRTKADV